MSGLLSLGPSQSVGKYPVQGRTGRPQTQPHHACTDENGADRHEDRHRPQDEATPTIGTISSPVATRPVTMANLIGEMTVIRRTLS